MKQVQFRLRATPLLTLCPALLFAVLILLVTVTGTNAAQKPNIIIIFTDDMGYGDLGCYGGKFVPTPHIDQLAKEGTRFTEFYVSSPICSPSRTGLLTGMYPARWNIKTFLQARAGNRAAGQDDFLNPIAPSLPRALKTVGYKTAHIGKWHLGGGRDVTNAPLFSAYGYDEHVSTYESPQPDPALTATNWIWSPEDKVKRWDRSAYFVDKTLDFLRRNKGEPCFVNFWPDDVHTPWIPAGTIPIRGKNQHESEDEFKKVLVEYDNQVGRLMSGLKELGLDRNTIVIFSSDNGPGPDFRGNPRSLGMRGRKGSLYEGGIRMPFIVRWPVGTPANEVNTTTLLNAVDLFPTLCKVAGASMPKEHKLDGEDLSRALHGKKVQRKKPMFWEFNHPGARNRTPQSDRNRSPSLAIRDGDWKLLINADGTGAELYNLKTDRNEQTNLADQHPKVAKRLSATVLEWKASLP
ncbi:MAG: sulfatase [Limisphaerales bacterium]